MLSQTAVFHDLLIHSIEIDTFWSTKGLIELEIFEAKVRLPTHVSSTNSLIFRMTNHGKCLSKASVAVA